MKLSKAKQPELFKDHAYKEIKKVIIQQQIEPGSTVYERSLSESLGISRTPLKLALQQLEMEGWIQSVPRKGILVQTIKQQDVDDVFQLRKANEALVVELLIPLLDMKGIQRLELLAQQVSLANEDLYTFVEYDSAFHLTLAELSQNQRLFKLMQNLTDHINWYRFAAIKAGIDLQEASEEHHFIIEGLKAKDVSQTKKIVSQHIDHIYRLIVKGL